MTAPIHPCAQGLVLQKSRRDRRAVWPLRTIQTRTPAAARVAAADSPLIPPPTTATRGTLEDVRLVGLFCMGVLLTAVSPSGFASVERRTNARRSKPFETCSDRSADGTTPASPVQFVQASDGKFPSSFRKYVCRLDPNTPRGPLPRGRTASLGPLPVERVSPGMPHRGPTRSRSGRQSAH